MFSPLMVLTWCFSIFVLVCFLCTFCDVEGQGEIELEGKKCSDRDV